MQDIITNILEYFNMATKNFDVYIVADTQNKTRTLNPIVSSHADETEFFSKEEFAQIASAIFNVFGYARVFYSEIEFIEYFICKSLNHEEIVVYNFSRDGQKNGKKSLIPAFCDLLDIKYTGSNAFVISLLRNKDIYTSILSSNKIMVPQSIICKEGTDLSNILKVLYGKKVIIKNTCESASIGLDDGNVFTLDPTTDSMLKSFFKKMNTSSLFVQEFIDGSEFEVLVLQYKGKYYALNPVEIILKKGKQYIDSETSNSYDYDFKISHNAFNTLLRQNAEEASSILNIKDYARFDFRVKDGVPYLFDIAGTPYTIIHSSIAYLFTEHYNLSYESIYKIVVACMLSNY